MLFGILELMKVKDFYPSVNTLMMILDMNRKWPPVLTAGKDEWKKRIMKCNPLPWEFELEIAAALELDKETKKLLRIS